MAIELKELAQQIRQKRLLLDKTDDSEIEGFNRLVRQHNALLEELRAQDSRVSALVESYSQKVLRQR